MKKLIKFNDFARFYTGFNERELQIANLAESLLFEPDDSEIKPIVIKSFYDKDCEIMQKYIKHNNIYEIHIKIHINDEIVKYVNVVCDSINKFQ